MKLKMIWYNWDTVRVQALVPVRAQKMVTIPTIITIAPAPALVRVQAPVIPTAVQVILTQFLVPVLVPALARAPVKCKEI